MTIVLQGVALQGLTLGGAPIIAPAGAFESFLDMTNIDVVSGLTTTADGGMNANTPTKYSGNPILTHGVDNAGAWDYAFNYCSVMRRGANDYVMWADGFKSDSYPDWGGVSCWRTSTDGMTWSAPNLGLYSFGGSTDNNIWNGATYGAFGYYNSNSLYLPRYALVWGGPAGGIYYCWESTDGYSYNGSYVPGVANIKTPALGDGVDSEGFTAAIRPDGTWISWYQKGYSSDTRSIGATTSDTTNFKGTWTDQGTVIATSGTNDQKYGIQVQNQDGLLLGFLGRYRKTPAKVIFAVALYISRDGITWTLRNNDWLGLGTSGAWDDTMVLGGNFIEVGNEWWFYYGGTRQPDDALTVRGDIGIAKIAAHRLGQVGTGAETGAITTVTLTTGEGWNLTVNANGTGGSVKAELLNPLDDSVLAGYSKDDMDNPITTDSSGTVVTWGGGVHVPSTQQFKIKFYVTNAILYRFQLT